MSASTVKAVTGGLVFSTFNGNLQMATRFFDQTTNNYYTDFLTFQTPGNITDDPTFIAYANSQILAESVSRGYTGFDASDIFWSGVTNFLKTPSPITPSLNSAFQISTLQNARVFFPVDITTSLSLTGGTAGNVTLKYADDSAFTTNVVTVMSGQGSNTGTLTIGLALSQVTTVTLAGFIPAGKYVKLITASTTGTATFAARAGQQVLEN